MSARATLETVMTEKQLQTHVTTAAKQLGWLVYHTWMSKNSTPGFPDLVLLRGGRMVVAELKRDGLAVTPAQLCWLMAFEQVPCVEMHVWRPEQWHDGTIEAVLR